MDALRGLVMIVMALDHTRDFISSSAQLYSPEDLTKASAILFLTRWITHFCAPTFMFTAGIGAFLRKPAGLSRFLVARGLWLIFLELTVMRWAYGFNFTYRPVFLIVFWVLGLSMIVLAALVRLPVRVLAVLSLVTIATHNLLDKVDVSWGGLWNVLHRPGFIPGTPLLVAYPLVPWFAVMAAGYCFGTIVREHRRDLMLKIGAGMTIGFVILRALNVYGDPQPWTGGLLAFLNVTKYPPSLEFLMMTLGPAILVLAAFDRISFGDKNPLIVFGRTPLFFFVLHFVAAHILAVALAWVHYGRVDFMLNTLPSFGGPMIPGYGYSLPVVYLCWLGIVFMFYFLCRWFAGVKAKNKAWWLSYL